MLSLCLVSFRIWTLQVFSSGPCPRREAACRPLVTGMYAGSAFGDVNQSNQSVA